MQREHAQRGRTLHDLREAPDHRPVLEIAALGGHRHHQVILDEEAKQVGRGDIQAEAPRDAVREHRAFFGVLPLFADALAGVMQQQREVKYVRTVQLLEHLGVLAVRRGLRLPDTVELFEADQHVLVGGVDVKELVLHQAREPAKLRDVLAEKIHLVHRPDDRRHAAAMVENLKERLPHMRVLEELPVHERERLADQLIQIGVQAQAALLRVEKGAHEPARLLAEHPVVQLPQLAIQDSEAVVCLAGGFPARQAQHLAQRLQAPGVFADRHPLLQRAGDQVDVPHVDIQIAHELLQAHARGTIGIAQRAGDGRLQILREDIHRRRGLREMQVHLVADAQEKVVRLP